MQEIPIKNMVCARCIKAVTGIFNAAGASVNNVQLGKVDLAKPLTKAQEDGIRSSLLREGFEWLDDKKVKLVEKIKTEIITLVHEGGLDEKKENLSE